MSVQRVKDIILWLNAMQYNLDYLSAYHLVCGLSAHDLKVLMTKDEGGK
jgi:hypothetical protein